MCVCNYQIHGPFGTPIYIYIYIYTYIYICFYSYCGNQKSRSPNKRNPVLDNHPDIVVGLFVCVFYFVMSVIIIIR